MLKKLLILFLFLWYFLFISIKIDLTTADLGRHIKNGELVLSQRVKLHNLLTTNFYSFENANFPVINHHWGSGVVFYLLYKLGGFSLLSLFYIFLSFVTLLIFFKVAHKVSSFRIAFLIALLLIPLLTDRREVRPEVFSYFFSSLFLYVLFEFTHGKLSKKFLFVLPILQIFWVNIHIYFFFGFLIILIFFLSEILSSLLKSLNSKISFGTLKYLVSDEHFKYVGLVLLLTSLSSFLNPVGLKWLTYPFEIFNNYGYRIVENQPVWFLEHLGFIQNSNFLNFKITIFILLLSFILILFFDRKSLSFTFFSFALILSCLAFFAIRNFTLFALFTLPVLSSNLSVLIKRFNLKYLVKDDYVVLYVLFIVALTFLISSSRISFGSKSFGLGLMPHNDSSARFFADHKIKGPIFNNYDIGGYLIFYLYPKESVFVDNRPEAYPATFFEKIYIPMQENEEVWNSVNEKHNFNVIFFSYKDYTPWAQAFLLKRVKDPLWAPVFVDDYALILLKRNIENEEVIKKFELPKGAFKLAF